MRIVKTDKVDPEERRFLHEQLIGMGSSASMVLDERDVIEFIENNQSDSYSVFDVLIKFINSEFEKIILGSNNIMGSNGSVGTYGASKNSSAEFHKFLTSSLRQITFWVNDTLIPKLKNLGVVDNVDVIYKFCDIDNLAPEDYINLYKVILPFYNVNKDELYKHVGITVEDKPIQANPLTNGQNMKPQAEDSGDGDSSDSNHSQYKFVMNNPKKKL